MGINKIKQITSTICWRWYPTNLRYSSHTISSFCKRSGSQNTAKCNSIWTNEILYL